MLGMVFRLLVILFVGPTEAIAQTPAVKGSATTSNFDRNRYSIKYQKLVLPNGLTLLVHEDIVKRE